MSIIDELAYVFTPKRKWREPPKLDYPKPLFTKATFDAEIRLREIELKEKEMEVRRLEALAKLKKADLDTSRVQAQKRELRDRGFFRAKEHHND